MLPFVVMLLSVVSAAGISSLRNSFQSFRRRMGAISRQSEPFEIDLTLIGRLDESLGNVTRYDRYSCIPRTLCETAARRHMATTTKRPPLEDKKANRYAGEVPEDFNPFSLRSLLSVADLILDIASMNSYRYTHAAYMGTQMTHPKYCRSLYPRCPDDISNLIAALDSMANRQEKMQHRVASVFKSILERVRFPRRKAVGSSR